MVFVMTLSFALGFAFRVAFFLAVFTFFLTTSFAVFFIFSRSGLILPCSRYFCIRFGFSWLGFI